MKYKTVIIDSKSENFPKRLLEIKNPPKALYCIGDLSLLNKGGIAVVGSRKNSIYGERTAKFIGEKLACCNINVISGLAYGIDAIAHESVISFGGKAIAVLGMGIEKFSPVKNQWLLDEIIEKGLVVSEYANSQKGSKISYPLRNRIISGMSDGVIIVEANRHSGALITANLALEQGKSVFAVPGNIDSENSRGTNDLIRDGAIPFLDMSDLENEIGITLDPQIDKNQEFQNCKLGRDEIIIMEILKLVDGASIDFLSEKSKMSIEKVNGLVTVLEIKNMVKNFAGRLYLKKNK